ncbi:DnaJ-domain-containing protein [Imleria badia]|nr:DnaJ-domain-containing protein [Imleria badia]
MEEDSEISQLFPGEDNVDLYAVLALTSDASPEDIRKSYRKLALVCHPDKHTNSSEHERAHALKRFQQIGFAYAILSDEKRRKKYDRTGTTGEGLIDPGDEGGWDAYFEDLFDRVTRGRLDEMKKEYQGSSEEVEDLMAAYHETEGSLDEIMKRIPHSTAEDEPRFIHTLSKLIADAKLPDLPLWQSSSADEKAKLVRKKQTQKEAKEAEELAKDLGVWDEFYGSGKVGARKGKGKQKEKEKDDTGDEDVSALQALILQRKKARNGFLDNLAAKYMDMDEEQTARKSGAKGKKRKKATEHSDPDETESPRKRPRSALPEIDEEEFEKIRSNLTSGNATASASGTDKKRGTRSKKAK